MLKSLSLRFAETILYETFATALKIEPLNAPLKEAASRKNYLLYMHIPFCHDFCPFCSFHKFKYDMPSAKKYFASLREEMRIIHDKGFSFDRIYVGGGTPLIAPEELFETLMLAKKLFPIKDVSCESSPSTMNASILHEARGLIDRISVGVQTFDDALLKRMGRYARYGSSSELQDKIRSVEGILPILSLDLIFNFPQQTPSMLEEDLRIAKSLPAQQITTYPLMSSSMMREEIHKTFGSTQRTHEWKLYQTIRHSMSEYTLNNAWSFSTEKNPLSDEYVIHYPEYIGIGSGAFSYLNNRIYVNAYDLNTYTHKIYTKEHSSVASSKTFSSKQQMQYAFLLQLFSGEVDVLAFNERFNVSLENALGIELWWLEKNKAIIKNQKTITTTLFGDFLCLRMMKTFYTQMDNVRAYLQKEFLQKVS